jgi:hypothetical protein
MYGTMNSSSESTVFSSCGKSCGIGRALPCFPFGNTQIVGYECTLPKPSVST